MLELKLIHVSKRGHGHNEGIAQFFVFETDFQGVHHTCRAPQTRIRGISEIEISFLILL